MGDVTPAARPHPGAADGLPARARMPIDQLWARTCERLATELPEQQFNTWIRPLPPAESGGPAAAEGALTLRLTVPNRFKLDWIRAQYAPRIEGIASELAGCSARLELAVAPRAPAAAPFNPAAGPQQAPNGSAVARAGGQPVPATPAGTWAGSTQVAGGSRLNPALTFDTLVPGRANQMARTAALHVAGAPGAMYNPLFIYGGVGLGKTHLIHAVGNALLKDRPDARVLYLHAEQFISDVVSNYQRKTFDALKAKYHALDLLLIDDVQFFAGKDRTQEEFFNAFEALLAKKAHIIMTSDTYPKGLANIDERLTSRFDAGLTVAIEPPELEMRVAILKKKAEALRVLVDDDVAFLIAKNLRSNVRELEGALNKVVAYARFHGRQIGLEVAKEALKDLLHAHNRQLSIEHIQKTVADYYKIKIADMHSKKRTRVIARPRQVAMWLAKELTPMSLPAIGEAFGGRDHTTVLHACRTIAELRLGDTQLNHDLHVLTQVLRG